MMSGHWAVMLNLIGIAMLGIVIGAALSSVLWLMTGQLVTKLAARARQKLLWLWVSAPWLTGGVVVALYMPSFRQGNHVWFSDIAHWHHPDVFSIGSWHGLILLAFVAFSVIVITGKLQQWFAAHQQLNTLRTLCLADKSLPLHQQTHYQVIVVDSDLPCAFTGGLINPVCYVTSGLVARVSQQDLDIVIEHEAAHVRQKDTLFRWWFDLMASYYPRKIGRQLVSQFCLTTELLADKQVAQRHCEQEIATTLVKVARLQQIAQKTVPSLKIPPVMSYFGADHIKQRVLQLVDPTENRSAPVALIMLTTVCVVLLCASAVDSVHHLIESIFSH
jgi:beta-lactamase regulating signal transducer with metallopeptidase domain